ncbi:MAG: hypothetical protein R3D67_20500 [Hyphomicrobiaceae bacterium]
MFDLIAERCSEAGLDRAIMQRVVLIGAPATVSAWIGPTCSWRQAGGDGRQSRLAVCRRACVRRLSRPSSACSTLPRDRPTGVAKLRFAGEDRGYLHRVERWIRESFQNGTHGTARPQPADVSQWWVVEQVKDDAGAEIGNCCRRGKDVRADEH